MNLRGARRAASWRARVAVLAALVLVLALTSTGLAGTGVGAVFNLGRTNSVDALSVLTGAVSGRILQVTNASTGTGARAIGATSRGGTEATILATNQGGGPALSLNVAPGKAPLAVNSPARVANLNADRLDGLDSASFARSYKRTVLVSPVGTPAENGTVLLAAMTRTTGASASTPYVVRVEPGVYDLGARGLAMKPYVDIEGSGEGVTTITAAARDLGLGTVMGANNAELRFLTVESRGSDGATFAAAIANRNASPKLLHVTAKAAGSNQNFAIYNENASPILMGVTASATGGSYTVGIQFQGRTTSDLVGVTVSATGGRTGNLGVGYGEGSSVVVDGSAITASGGNQSIGLNSSGNDATIRILNSRIAAATLTVTRLGTGTTSVAGSLLAGGPVRVGDSSTVRCAGVYDEEFAFYADTCP